MHARCIACIEISSFMQSIFALPFRQYQGWNGMGFTLVFDVPVPVLQNDGYLGLESLSDVEKKHTRIRKYGRNSSLRYPNTAKSDIWYQNLPGDMGSETITTFINTS